MQTADSYHIESSIGLGKVAFLEVIPGNLAEFALFGRGDRPLRRTKSPTSPRLYLHED